MAGKQTPKTTANLRAKAPSESATTKTEVVCPNDTNPMGILQGGRLVQWMDIAAAVCAQTHAEKICVTASLDKVSFNNPARVGDIVTMEARIARAFTTSMEIRVQAWSRSVGSQTKQKISESYFTFVALDNTGNPARVMRVQPGNAKEKQLFDEAGQRKAGGIIPVV
jgi:acyl-CoA hydrolase